MYIHTELTQINFDDKRHFFVCMKSTRLTPNSWDMKEYIFYTLLAVILSNEQILI